MKRIFLGLVVVGTLLLTAAYLLGLNIEDARAMDASSRGAVRWHFLISLAALCFASLVHGVWLTYFMGTGRWMEETSNAYSLPAELQAENRAMKYGTIPLMAIAFLLLLGTGGVGAAVDPGSSVDFRGFGGLSGEMFHFLLATGALVGNLMVNVLQFQSIDRNSRIVEDVMHEVRRIRKERGLPLS